MLDAVVLFAICAATLAMGAGAVAVLTRGLPAPVRAPLLVYLLTYLVTYVIGAVLIALTNGDIFQLYWDETRHLPSSVVGSPTYWVLLLLPFVVVPLAVRVGMPPGVPEAGNAAPRPVGLLWPTIVFLVAAALLFLNPIYAAAWRSPLSYFQGDVGQMYMRRQEVLGSVNTWQAGIIYMTCPFLTFVVVNDALESRRGSALAVALGMTALTAGLQLVLAQGAPTGIFGLAMLLSIAARGTYRHRRVLIVGGAALAFFALEYLTFKYEARSSGTRFLEPVMRMPSIYPYYLLFVDAYGHPGAPILSLLTGGRLGSSTPWPTLIGQFTFSGQELEYYTPAPAHVVAYAESGFIFSIIVLLVVAGAIRACGAILSRPQSWSLWRALGISCCASIYMTTQSGISALVTESWGILWAVVPFFVLLVLKSLEPRLHSPAFSPESGAVWQQSSE